jgi:hypothetical protein
MNLATKYKRYKLLFAGQVVTINQLNQMIEQLKITNMNDLANRPEEQRHHQIVALKLDATIESTHIAAKANIDAVNDKYAAQIDALNHDWKHYTESKLKMIAVHYEKTTKSDLDGLTEKLENLLI